MGDASPGTRLQLRLASREDARLLWLWRNEPQVRRQSVSTAEIPWEEHLVWLEAKLRQPGECRLWVGENEGGPIGQIRYDRQPGGAALVSLLVAAEWRGRGLGTQLLRLSRPLALSALRVDSLQAWVRRDNPASHAIFVKAGYEAAEAALPDGQPGWWMRWTSAEAGAA